MVRLLGDPPPSPLPHDWGSAACLDLVNSSWTDHIDGDATYDRLLAGTFRRVFVERWNLKVSNPNDEDTIRDMARLRALLRRVLENYAAGEVMSPFSRRQLEAELNRARIVQVIIDGDFGPRLDYRRQGDGWDVAAAEIVQSALGLMAARRVVKVCANPNCSWMFVDESKPHTRRWCNASVCGSLVNVRRLRRRQRAAARRSAPP